MVRGKDGKVRNKAGNILYIGTISVDMRIGDFAKDKEEFIKLLKVEFLRCLNRENDDEFDIFDEYNWRITDVKEQ